MTVAIFMLLLRPPPWVAHASRESDDFPSYYIWMDTLVFDKVMYWTGMEKILLDNNFIL